VCCLIRKNELPILELLGEGNKLIARELATISQVLSPRLLFLCEIGKIKIICLVCVVG
jgi:hypothetical protein